MKPNYLTEREVTHQASRRSEPAVLVQDSAGGSLEVLVVGRQQVSQRGHRQLVGSDTKTFGLFPEPFGLGGQQFEGELHGHHFLPSSAG